MNILIVEDNKALAETLKFRLEKEGFAVDVCHDGEEGLYYMKEKIHDIVLLDRLLPLMDGLTVLKKARNSHVSVPVIMLTALGCLDDRITGLNTGADDYVVKPFAFTELLARIQCILRRPGNWEASAALNLGDISFNPEDNRLCRGEKECTLSGREGSLLEVFLRNPGQTLTRGTLLNRVWGPDNEVEEGNLDNYIHFLRRRLKAVGSAVNLKTVRGVGYQLEIIHNEI